MMICRYRRETVSRCRRLGNGAQGAALVLSVLVFGIAGVCQYNITSQVGIVNSCLLPQQ